MTVPPLARHRRSPREAVIVGIDGGYLRNWHDKRKKFEVIVGKSMAEDRDDRYFGLVRSQDAAPKRRFCEVLRRQGLPADQPVTVLTDGGDSVRALVGDLPAGSEHHLDWFHVAMRMTVLGQYAKGLAHHNPLEATALQDRLERIKWRLWHGDAGEALNRARELAEDVAALASGYPGLTRLVKATAGLVTYIENNAAAIADYASAGTMARSSRPPSPNPPSTSSSAGALPRSSRCSGRRKVPTSSCSRTRTLDGTLHDLFTSWYPAMPANDVQPAPLAAAARNAQECSGIRSDCLWSIIGTHRTRQVLGYSDISFYARSERGAEMGNHEKQNRVTLTDLMSNWWSKHPVGPLAPLG